MYKLLNLVLDAREHFPKAYKYAFGEKLVMIGIEFCELIQLANSTKDEEQMRDFLESQLLLNLHQRKIYIQPARKGVPFVGAMILPGRTYISNRTRGRMYDKLHYYNKLAEEGKALQYLDKFVQSMNSYLGMTVHHKAYNVRKKFVEHISPVWWQYVYMNAGFKVLVIKKKYHHREILKQAVRKGGYKSLLAPELF